MKKQLIWLPVLLTVAMLTAWNKPLRNLMTAEKTVSKNISFAVYTAADYNSNVYNTASAKLQVTVVKVRGNQRTTVWQKQYDAKLLKQYPSLEHAIAQNVVINNVVDNKERLEVVYTLTYNANGSQMQLQDGTVISQGEKDGKLFINI